MHSVTILGDGGLGPGRRGGHLLERARTSGWEPDIRVLGRPPSGRHRRPTLASPSSSSRPRGAEAVAANLEAALAVGVPEWSSRPPAGPTTGRLVESILRRSEQAPSRPRTSASASSSSGGSSRRRSSCSGRSRPLIHTCSNGIAARSAIARRGPRSISPVGSPAAIRGCARDDLEVVSVRAGSSPGMHLVGFDAPGETVELRLRPATGPPTRQGSLPPPTGWSGHLASPGCIPSNSSSMSSSLATHRCLKGAPRCPTRPRRPARPRGAPTIRSCAAPSPRSSRRSRADGSLDEAAFRRLVSLAGPRRHRRPRALRHDRRIPHPERRGARATDRH